MSSLLRNAESRRSAFCKGVDGGVFGHDAEVERRVAEGQIEIDQQGALAGLLGQRYGEVAGQGGDARAALGAQKYQQLAAGLSWPAGPPSAAPRPAPGLRPWCCARRAG